jgi:membrane associated rhomboid family serine protease
VSKRGRMHLDTSQLRITRGALIVAGIQVGLSLVWLLADESTRQSMRDYLAATPDNIFHHYRVWTLVTSPFLEVEFLSLLLSILMLWMFVPTLERFWGTPRFYRFVAVTSLAGTVAGTAMGLALGHNHEIVGLSPFIYASVVAFGIVYARQPVQFFGVLPLSGRQLMFGFIGFLVLFITLQGLWEKGAAFAAAMIAAAILTSKRWSPALALKRWRIARARARLSVIDGGAPRAPKPRKPDEKFLN